MPLYATEKLAIEPFGSLEGVLRGDPIRIFPVGKFYRDDRVLDVTPQRLKEFAANIHEGLPRFEVPINLEHEKQWGRYGSVLDLEYQEQGLDGPGLYATRYQLTPEGRTLLESQRFKGLSGEAVWTLYDGAKYQDPQTGAEHDNVLVGLALTNTPFFGKDVNMYSAQPPADNYRTFDTAERKAMAKAGSAMPDGSYPIANTGDLQNAIHAIGRGKGSHAAIKAHIIKRAKALGATKMLPQDWMDDGSDDVADTTDAGDGMSDTTRTETLRHNGFTKLNARVGKAKTHLKAAYDAIMDDDEGEGDAGGGDDAGDGGTADAAADESTEEKMDDEASEEGLARGKMKVKQVKQVDAASARTAQGEKSMTDKPEQFTVKAEEFEALKAKAAQVDKLAEQLSAQAAETLAIKRARRLDQLTAQCETFAHIGQEPGKLAEQFQTLEEKAPEQFTFFTGLLATLETQLVQSQLFSQVSSPRGRNAPESFETAIETELATNFGGNRAKYTEAFNAVSVKRPDLAQEYMNRGRA